MWTQRENYMNGKDKEIHRLVLKRKKEAMERGRFYIHQRLDGWQDVFPQHCPCTCRDCNKLHTVMCWKDLPKTKRFKIRFLCLDCGNVSMEEVWNRGKEDKDFWKKYGMWPSKLTYKK